MLHRLLVLAALCCCIDVPGHFLSVSALISPPYVRVGTGLQVNEAFDASLSQSWGTVMCGDGSILVSVTNNGAYGLLGIFNCVRGLNCQINKTISICGGTGPGQGAGTYGGVEITSNCTTIIASCYTMSQVTLVAVVDLVNGNWTYTSTLVYNCPIPFCSQTSSLIDIDICPDRSAIVTGINIYNKSVGAIVLWTPVPGTLNWVINTTIQGNGSVPQQGGSVGFAKSVPCNLVFWAGYQNAIAPHNQNLWMAQLSSSGIWAQYGQPLAIFLPASIVSLNNNGLFANAGGTIIALANPGNPVSIVQRTGSTLSMFQTVSAPFDYSSGGGFGGEIWMPPSAQSLLICGPTSNTADGMWAVGMMWLFQQMTNLQYTLNGSGMPARNDLSGQPLLISGMNNMSVIVVATRGYLPDATFPNDGGILTFVPGPCFTSPCLNSGLCQSDVTFPANYSCLCTDQWTGSNCSVPVSVPYVQIGTLVQALNPSLYQPTQTNPHALCPDGSTMMNILAQTGVTSQDTIDIFRFNVTSGQFQYNTTLFFNALCPLNGPATAAFSGNCTRLVVACPFESGNPFLLVWDLINGIWNVTAKLLFAPGSQLGRDVIVSLDGTTIVGGASTYNSAGAVVFYQSIPGTHNWTLVTNITGTGLTGITDQLQAGTAGSISLALSIPSSKVVWTGWDVNHNTLTTLWVAQLMNGMWQQVGTNFTIFGGGSAGTQRPCVTAMDASGSVVLLSQCINNGTVYVINSTNGAAISIFQTIHPPSDVDYSCINTIPIPIQFGTYLWMDVTALRAGVSAPGDACGRGAWWFYQRPNTTSFFQVVGPKMFGNPSDKFTGNGGASLSASLNGSLVAAASAGTFFPGGIAGPGGIYVFQTEDLCSRGPCQNGGTCTSTNSTVFTCNCPAAYTGATCQLQLPYVQIGPMVQPFVGTYLNIDFDFRPMCPNGLAVMNLWYESGSNTNVIGIFRFNSTTNQFQYNATIPSFNLCGNRLTSASFSGDCNTIVAACESGIGDSVLVLDLVNGVWNKTATLFFHDSIQFPTDVVISLDRTIIMASAPGYETVPGVPPLKGIVVFWDAVPGTFNWTLNANITGTGLTTATTRQGYTVNLVPSIPCNRSFWIGYDSDHSTSPTIWMAQRSNGKWQQFGTNFTIFGVRILNVQVSTELGSNSAGDTVIMGDFDVNLAWIISVNGNSGAMSLFQTLTPPSDAVYCPAMSLTPGFGSSVWMDTSGLLVAVAGGTDSCGIGAWWVYKRASLTLPFQVSGSKMIGSPSDTLTQMGWGLTGSLTGSVIGIGTSTGGGGVANGGGVFVFQSQDICAFVTCANGATCTAVNATAYTCQCVPGFLGSTCQTLIDYCVSLPCQNGGTCNDIVNGFSCKCVVGYSGVVCQTVVDNCASFPCQHGGTCNGRVNGFNCTCGVGYSGTLCQTLVDNCASMPCQHGGTCNDVVNAFNCTCAAGYSGLLCQTRNIVDACASTPCQNGGTCFISGSSYNCTCPAGSSRPVCAICPVGTSSSDGASCVMCNAGSYQNVSGSSQCSPCPANTFAGSSRASACIACPSGFVATLPLGSQNCTALSDSSNSNSGVSLSAGDIAGIVIGGLIFIALSIGIWLWVSSATTAAGTSVAATTAATTATTATSSSVPLSTKFLVRHAILPAKPFYRASV